MTFPDKYLEENPATKKLAEDAADGPDVDGVGVVLGAEEDLGGAVVLGDHLLGHWLAGVLLFHPETEDHYSQNIVMPLSSS